MDDERWFEKLDAIVTGREVPTSADDDLLHIAAKLVNALSPLKHLDAVDVQPASRVQGNFQRQHHTPTPARSRKRSWRQTLLAGAAVLLILFGIVSACPMNTQVEAATRDVGQSIWQAATSFEEIDASSLALLAVKKSGVYPLLPATVPAETQAVAFGIIMDDTNPPALRAFTADYRIAGQDVSLYEQAADLLVPSSAAQNVTIGTYEGHVFQDNAGNRILQWYQDGMTCQMASTLPTYELLALARQFHPIARWELIL